MRDDDKMHSAGQDRERPNLSGVRAIVVLDDPGLEGVAT